MNLQSYYNFLYIYTQYLTLVCEDRVGFWVFLPQIRNVSPTATSVGVIRGLNKKKIQKQKPKMQKEHLNEWSEFMTLG